MLLKRIGYTKNQKVEKFSEYILPIVFLRDLDKGHLSLEDADDRPINFVAKLNNLYKSEKKKKQLKKSFF